MSSPGVKSILCNVVHTLRMAQVRSLFSKLEVLCRSLCPKSLVSPYKMWSPSQCFPVWECICLVFDFVGHILSDCTLGILFQLLQNSPLAFPGIKQNNSRFLSFVYSTTVTYLIFVCVFLALIINPWSISWIF